MTTALVESCATLFPDAEFSNFYGSSEIYTFAVRNNLAENPGSAGRAGIGQILRVVRADADERVGSDEQVPVGETGEIIASSGPRRVYGLLETPGRRREVDP